MPSFTGTNGNDTLAGSVGADTLTGLAGNDTYTVNNLGDVIVETALAGSGVDTVRTSVLDTLSTYSLERWANVENLIYTGLLASQLQGNALANVISANATRSVADTLLGGAGNDTLFGFGGSDRLLGGTGDDSLDGGTGDDTMTGEAGNDTYVVDSLGDLVVEAGTAGSGIDTIRSSVLDSLATYSLEFRANVEHLIYTGQAAAQLKGNGLANTIDSNAAVTANDTLYGAGGHDTLSSHGGNDLLQGGTGNDVIDGGTGADTMVGGSGHDRYLIDAAGDRVFEYGGGGFDTIVSTVARDLRLPWTAQVEGLTYTGTTAATLHGNALDNAITSTGAGNDTLFGGAGSDTLDGGNGNDSLVGGAGDDFYRVSATDLVLEQLDEGIDTFIGGITNIGLVNGLVNYATTIENLFYTGATGAPVNGNALDNVLGGGSGNDTLAGLNGNDTLLGGAGADSIVGGEGDDVLYGGGNPDFVYIVDRLLVPDASVDRLVGGNGNDRYLIDNTDDVVTETTTGGTLDVVISAIDNSLARYANVEALVLQSRSTAWFGQGTAGANILVGNEGDNYLVGGAGDDTLAGFVDNPNLSLPQSDILDGGSGDDVLVAFDFGAGFSSARELTLFGGIGDDIYVLGTRADGYGGQDTGGVDLAILLTSGSIDNLEGVEDIVLWGFNADLDAFARSAIDAVFAAANAGAAYSGAIGNAYDATGNDLDNLIFGNDLDNRLIGGAGDDTIAGYDGNDTLEGGSGIDSLVGGNGNDWYYLDTGDVAEEAIDGGFDVLASATLDTNAEFDAYANFEGWQYLGAADVDLNRGTTNTSNDLLIGGGGNDTIAGYDGNDTLGGAAGADSVLGGAGDDSMFGDAGNDTLAGGTGEDTIDGGAGDDVVNGDLADDRLLGGGGNDSLDGGGNFDTIEGGAGNDLLAGGEGNDALYGEAGVDVLYGEAQNDLLVGGAGADEIWGGSTSVTGSFGDRGDHLWGGNRNGNGDGAADLFVFDDPGVANLVVETFNGSGVYDFVSGATIGDFEQGLDTIFVAASLVGNLDNVLDNVSIQPGAGGTFDAGSELVIVRGDVADSFAFSASSFFSPIDAFAVSDAIGSADAAIGVGETRLFVVDDGAHSALFLFASNNGDAAVTIDELYLLTVVTGETALTGSDFGLF